MLSVAVYSHVTCGCNHVSREVRKGTKTILNITIAELNLASTVLTPDAAHRSIWS